MSTSSPSFSADEVRHRESVLLRCFQCCDCNCDGVIDGKELEAVARAFTLTNSHSHHPAANAANSSAAANGSAAPSTSTSTSHSSSTGMNVDQEVKVILGKLDKNGDGVIDVDEWTAVLFDLFRFMSADAFDKHCEELLLMCRKQSPAVGLSSSPNSANSSHPAAGAHSSTAAAAAGATARASQATPALALAMR